MSKMRVQYITKTDIKRGMQCIKSAYMHKFHKDLATPTEEYQQLIMKRGDKVGQIACEEFDPKTSVMCYQEGDSNDQVLEKTKAAMERVAKGEITTLFEAGFMHDQVFVRVDILHLVDKENFLWELYEVKSSSNLDDEYITDANIQKYVLNQAGINLKEVYVWYINKECVLPDIKNLFIKKAVSSNYDSKVKLFVPVIAKLKKVFSEEINPEQTMDENCKKPYECPFLKYCKGLKNVPEFSVFDVPRISNRAFEYVAKGKLRIEDLDEKDFTAAQARVISVTKSQKMYLNKEGVKEALDKFVFPLYMLDFEAMEYDFPGLVNTNPGLHTPFQFSLHVLETPTSEIKKLGEYIHTDLKNIDPRVEFLNKLSPLIGKKGSIVAFSMGYEKSKLEKMSVIASPEMKETIKDWLGRFVDPLPILQKHVYHPEFYGSYSIKYVAPALLGPASSYESLAVKNGVDAVLAFRKYLAPETTQVERDQLIKDLLIYCDKDTLVMGQIVQWLYANSK